MENLLVYHVDIGRWITCDFSLLNKTVSELKQQIEKKADIPLNKQVLLVSGGGHLDPSKPVSCYCAGTDTSPFFLFSKRLIDHPEPPTAYFHNRPDIDFMKEHHGTQGMTPTIEALNIRVSLAQQFNENAKYNLNSIEMLINDQHMMHQGWSAAVANMLDTVEKFKFKAEIFEMDFKRYLDGRDDSINLLNNFNNSLAEIAKIPLLPALLENNAEERARMDTSIVNLNNVMNQSLLEWVTACQGLNNLEHIVEHCESSLKQFDENMLNMVLQEVSTMNEISSRSDYSEIKGLEHRLFKLAQMMDESKRLAAEQTSLFEAIKMNHARAANEGDMSVISVLLASHDKQLEMMNKNNLRLCDIRNRSIRAKQELCQNLHPRLKWLIVIENKVSDIEAIMLLYSDSIKLTREYLDIVEQLDNTPKLYFNAVAEVVRRRIFSQALLIWSSDLACHMMARYSDEIAKRKNFQSQFEGHFLNPLFPGLEDMPPPYATQAPSIFDNNLPKLCLDDLDQLIKQLPQIAEITSVPNFNAITQFFLSKSILEDGILAIEGNNDHKSVAMETSNVSLIANTNKTVEEKLNVIMTAVGIGSCQEEMQQDSEVIKRTHSEMENDSYSPDSSSMLPHKYAGNTQEYAVELIKKNLCTFANLANNSLKSVRSDLDELKHCFIDHNIEMDVLTNDLKLKHNMQNCQLQQLIQFANASNHELNEMKNRINELESLLEIHIKKEEHERQLRMRLENERDEWMQRELEHARKEITNQLTIMHKKELEMMQVRFKLVTQATNMERSLSEQNLEKNKQRHDVIELVNHEAMMAQLKEDLLIEKEQAIQEIQRMCEQKILRERQLLLFKSDEKRDEQYLWSDKNRTSKYLKEKCMNELRLSSKSELVPRSNSISTPDWELDNSSATNSVFVDLSKSSSSESEEGKLSIISCNVGDFVLVIWDSTYKNYIVYQENKKNIVFLHPESIDTLSLKHNPDEIPAVQHFSAEVLHKEFCQAVKEGNRYKVPRGTKFYRVKVQLLKTSNNRRTISLSDSSCPSVTYV
ncbi:RB1-inducible coiled-coil protein 1 [Daktulosphaira vitifoliae]|uniref:RB1-inducible coiled-coil protein 1 n=1 Tax=Daktulosphaira vitifoliae TaxID=58002 RepID=UPI0021AA978C|nr:RB1-inducible coiled-coil protein 1 [Daktulosphaira vitifoliae]